MSIWEQVEALVAEGKGATINLVEAQEVIIPRKTKHERYGSYLPKHSQRHWERYAGCTNGTSRPRCHARGCNNYLTQGQAAVCSEKCEKKVVEYCLKMLALLHYNLVDRLDDFELKEHGAVLMEDRNETT